jgi:hypothetical protein
MSLMTGVRFARDSDRRIEFYATILRPVSPRPSSKYTTDDESQLVEVIAHEIGHELDNGWYPQGRVKLFERFHKFGVMARRARSD